MGSSQWIDAMIEEDFRPCNLEERARSAVKALMVKYNERLIKDSLRKAVRQAKGLARQENRSYANTCRWLWTKIG